MIGTKTALLLKVGDASLSFRVPVAGRLRTPGSANFSRLGVDATRMLGQRLFLLVGMFGSALLALKFPDGRLLFQNL